MATRTTNSAEEPVVIGGGVYEQNHYLDHPELGTEKISYEHVISPHSFELEREAIFRKSWLNVGRDTLLPQIGSYYTKEIEVLDYSIIVVRDTEEKIRAFHNVCPHRGNKLVWDGHPKNEVSGRCPTFICKYHGIGYGLDGKVSLLKDPDAWFGSQGRDLQLAEVPVETWNGFIFVNFESGGPSQSLREYMGQHIWNALDDFPTELYTERVFAKSEINSNWKTLHDAFSEGWHGSTLHSQAMVGLRNVIFRNPPSRFEGPHRTALACGTYSPDQHNFEIERISKASVTGTRLPPARPILPPKSGVPDGREDWLCITYTIFPNFQFQIYAPGWIMLYHYWPLSHNQMRFEVTQYYQPAKNFTELFAQMVGVSIVSDNVRQDLGTLEATQRGLQARVFDQYPLIDEENNLRHFHFTIDQRIKAYEAEQSKPKG